MEKLLHLPHIEDRIIIDGLEGFYYAARTLRAVHDRLCGLVGSDLHITTKFDGSPSIVFGHSQEFGDTFFVGTKSVFNKSPKVNITTTDIFVNHQNQGLRKTLDVALRNLPLIFEHEYGRINGVYQGDIMYTAEDVYDIHNGHDALYEFAPNVIRYRVERDSAEGKKIDKAQIGIAVHTRYIGETLATSMAVPFDGALDRFIPNDNVHLIDVGVNWKDYRSFYVKHDQWTFLTNINCAGRLANDIFRDWACIDFIPYNKEILEDMLLYVNHCVRTQDHEHLDGLTTFIEERHQDKADGCLTAEAKNRHTERGKRKVRQILEKEHLFGTILDIHAHLKAAKMVLLDAMRDHNVYNKTIDGRHVGPEGYVVTREGLTSKMVNRNMFSFHNFMMKDGQQ